MTYATGNAVSTDALRRIRRLCRDPQDEDLRLVSDAADRSTGPGIETRSQGFENYHETG
jgi:hypothetical protein